MDVKTDYDKLNDYLRRVIELDKVGIRRKLIELQRVVTCVKTGTPYEEIQDIEQMECDEIVEYLKKTYKLNKILDEFDNDDLKDHIIDDYFIAEDEEEAAKILIDSGNVDLPLINAGNNLPDFRKEDSFSLIENIVNREGWNYLYDLLEPQKDKLHFI